MKRSAAEVYKTQAIMTAPPAKLVAMCYDRAIGALRDAIRAIEAGDIQSRCDNATRAANIIAHLWGTLDMKQGGEIAENLSNIYGFAMRRLPDVNMRNDASAAEDVISLLLPLSQSWNELADRGEVMPSAMPDQNAAPLRPAPPPRPVAAAGRAQPTPTDRPNGGITLSV